MRGSVEAHNRLVQDVLILLGSEARELCRVWRNETGMAYRDGEDGRRIYIAYGLKGSADILGILTGGRFLALECKTGQAVQSEQQVRFELMIRRFGGLYAVVRSSTQALELVRNATQGRIEP